MVLAEDPSKVDESTLPFVSIIIPTFNDSRTIEACLDSIMNLDYPREKYEVILVDKSVDDTVEKSSKYEVKVIACKRNLAGARNEGINAAKGDLIAFIDADATADRRWLLDSVSYFSDPKLGAIGGPNFTPKNASFLSVLYGEILGSFFGSGPMRKRWETGAEVTDADERSLIGCNFMIRKKSAENILTFNETLVPCEENLFFYMLKKKGYNLAYNPKMVVWHERRDKLGSILKTQMTYGRGRGEFITRWPGAFKFVFLIPMLFLLYLASLPLLFLLVPFVSSIIPFLSPLILNIVFLIPLVIYFCLLCMTSISIGRKQKNFLMFLAAGPLSFGLHVVYALGFILGILRALKRKIKKN
ncbi:MAG: glycosyltransferase [Candidatus Hodarchaeota archaeon]